MTQNPHKAAEEEGKPAAQNGAEGSAGENAGSVTTENAENAGSPAQEQRLAVMESALAETRDQMLRALAEAENTRKRLVREREDVRKYAISEFARDLLDFADNFRRALAAIPADLKTVDERVGNVVAGLEAMEQEFLKTLEKQGVRKIEPLGEPFDANFHEAMFEAPGTGKAPGIIVQLIEPGYVLHDRLLRPARVGVARNEEQGAPQKPGAQIDREV